MSITRLQQARQMYAMGQRVGRIAFGGGGSYSSVGGYQGKGGAATGGAKGSKAGGAGTGTDNKGSTGGSNDNPFSSGYQGAVNQTKTATPMDVKEQYAVGNPTTLGAPIGPPTVSPFLENNRHDNYIDAFNLSNSTYKPINIPPFVPGGMVLNTVGNFLGNLGYKKNTQFFADNVAGKYGYGYGLEDYKRYMQDRLSGKVGAYGNEEQGQNAINRLTGNSSGGEGGGIMDVVVDDTTDDEEDTTNDLILRFLHDKPEEVINLEAMGVTNTDEMLQAMLDRAKNIYTTEDA
mgnify:CR=1 FL=1